MQTLKSKQKYSNPRPFLTDQMLNAIQNCETRGLSVRTINIIVRLSLTFSTIYGYKFRKSSQGQSSPEKGGGGDNLLQSRTMFGVSPRM